MQTLEISNITLKMIIDKGILTPGTRIVAMQDSTISGILLADGSINVNIDSGVVNYPFPSGAARAVEKRSINGWIYWGAIASGNLKKLSDYRELLYFSLRQSHD